MKITFDIDRYKELLEKNESLSRQGKSLLFENKNEFIELLSYCARLESQIYYERKEDYYFLISQCLEKVLTNRVTKIVSKSKILCYSFSKICVSSVAQW